MVNLVALFITVVFVTVSAADKSVELKKATVHCAGKIADIRKVDFRNFTYHFQEYGNVIIHKGSTKFKDVCFVVGGHCCRKLKSDGIIYGDITLDGHEEAIVFVGSSLCGSNVGGADVFIYTIKNAKPVLLASIKDGHTGVDNDLKQNCSNLADKDEYFQGIDALSIEEGCLVVRGDVAGYHQPLHYRATLKYRLQINKLMLVDKPVLTDVTQGQK